MPSLLIVEDNTDLRIALEMLFRIMGCEVRGAGSASEGLDELFERDFDLVITDWLLGDATGGAMLQRASVLGVLADAGIIIFSASLDKVTPECPPHSVLVHKSCSVDELVSRVLSMLSVPKTNEPALVRYVPGASITT